MYRIDTHQARTDLYGIGKGAAQVVDLTPTRENNKLAAEKEIAANKLKAEQEKDLYSQFGKINSNILPRDFEPIAAKTKALQEYVLKNHDKILSGDPTANIEFQGMLGDLEHNADASHNSLVEANKWNEEIKKNPSAYDTESLKSYNNWLTNTKEHGLNPNIQNYSPIKNVNLSELVDKDVEQAKKLVPDNYGTNKMTAEDTGAKRIASILQDPQVIAQANRDLAGRASDERLMQFGLDPAKRKEYTPYQYLMATEGWKYNWSNQKALPEYMANPSNKDTAKITTRDIGGGNYLTTFQSKKVNLNGQDTFIKDIVSDDEGNIIKATVVSPPSEEEKMVNNIQKANALQVQQKNTEQESAYQKAVATYKSLAGAGTFDKILKEMNKGKSIEDINKEYKIKNAKGEKILFPDRKAYPKENVPNPIVSEGTETIETDQKALNGLHDQLGITQTDLGNLIKGRKNIKNKEVNFEFLNTNNSVPSPPKTEAPKEKLYILNGKAYKQSALEKQGHDVSKLQEYKP